MSTPWWVTVLAAVLAASGAVASQVLNNRRADRRYERERDDAAHQEQRGRYARALAAVSAARAASGDGVAELAELRLAVADLEFSAPGEVLDRLAEVVSTLERWRRLRSSQPDGAPAVLDAGRQLTEQLAAARTAMRADLTSMTRPARR